MNTSTSRLMIAAAALAVAAGSASAQSLKAEIPFAFHTTHAAMSPGTYVITTNNWSGRQVVMLRNADTGKAVMLTQHVDAYLPAAQLYSGVPKLTFTCAGRACVLRELWKGGGSHGLRFVGPKLPPGEDARIAEVALTVVKAD